MQKPKQKKWFIKDKIPPDIDQKLQDYPQGLRSLLYNREIYTPEKADSFLNKIGSLYDPFLMIDMQTTVDRIISAVDQNEKITVYGDYDVDGVTASVILVESLRSIGATVESYIPDRFSEGYGLNVKALEHLAQGGTNLVITVDCGIRSIKEVEAANQAGLDMIVSDHHEPGSDLPPALAIVNPKQTSDRYPDKNLAGVGIAYKIIEALAEKHPELKLDPTDNLDLAAVGTIADIVSLSNENRALVKAGLKKLHKTTRLGLRSLIGAAGFSSPEKITAKDVGFMIGPRINAAGRLDSARLAFDLLISKNQQESVKLAQKLDNLNGQRQRMISNLRNLAEQERAPGLDHIVFSASEKFHQGVVGLIASRLCENHYLPAIVGHQKNGKTVASCRSIPEFHITNALNECADLLEKHGGHHMAAGFTIENEKIPELLERLEEISKRDLEGKELQPVLNADMEIALHRVPANFVERMELIEPTGQDNPEVILVSRDVTIEGMRTVGKEVERGQGKPHLSLNLRDGSKTYKAIAFRHGYRAKELKPGQKIDILYSVKENTFNNITSTQLYISDIKTPNS